MIQKEIKSCLNRNLIFVQEYEKNLEILNPLSILDRGYSIIQNQSGKSIKSNDDVKIGENLTARLNKGFIDIEVKNKKDAL
jgi:exodeoxyribonuclease VII large subunit